VVVSITTLPDRYVDGGNHVPTIGFVHPVGDRRSIGAQFGCYALTLARCDIELSSLELGGDGCEASGKDRREAYRLQKASHVTPQPVAEGSSYNLLALFV
jgi:hypothetical protein